MIKNYCNNCKYGGILSGPHCIPIRNSYTGNLTVKSQVDENSDGSCKYYERKWWKFWIEEDERRIK